MYKKTMKFYKPKMFQLQCLKALEQQIEDGKNYNEAEIGRIMGVNRSTISRCFKRYREEGFLQQTGGVFTRKGKEFLDYYKRIEADLYQYFASIGVGEKEQEQAVGGMFDTVDIETIQKICQKEKMHLRYESIDKNKGKEIHKISYQKLGEYLKEGFMMLILLYIVKEKIGKVFRWQTMDLKNRQNYYGNLEKNI